MSNQVLEIHLFDTEAVEEMALCGEDSSPDERMGVAYYLEMRKELLGVGTVCQGCKVLAMPLAEVISEERAEELEDEGLSDDAEDFRALPNKLARETGLDQSPD